MSLLNFIGGIFKPASDIVDELHVSDEERLALQHKIAEVESKVMTKMMGLQSEAISAQAQMEASIQANGNVFTKSVRPAISLMSFVTIMAMGFGLIEMNELIIKVCAGYLGIYAGLRTYEKRR